MSDAALKTQTAAAEIESRVASLDRQQIVNDLDVYGCAVAPALLLPDECRGLSALYGQDEPFRSRIVMARHGFGRGEYKYWAYPLPDTVAALRSALYPRLSGVANRWNKIMGIDVNYPTDHSDYLERCHEAGQIRPTPLLLEYGEGDFNCLHQDVYGDLVFPLQVAVLLSIPGEDFTGGEIRVDGTTAPDAVSGGGGWIESGRWRDFRGPSPSHPGHATPVPGQPPPRGQPDSIRPPAHTGNYFSRRQMSADQVEMDNLLNGARTTGSEMLAEGAMLLRGFVTGAEAVYIYETVQRTLALAPFRHMMTPGGRRMSVAMTNCGFVGWVTDVSGYRYDPIDPQTGKPWPSIPPEFRQLAERAAARAGFASFDPDSCFINRYEPGARLSLHQDRNEKSYDAPIVSLSLGLPAKFLFGGLSRSERVRRIRLESGDVAVWGGPARLAYHGVDPLAEGNHPLTGRCRLNLTFRKALS